MARNKGAGHWNYNSSLTQEEREKGRNIPELREWKVAVFIRDGFSCQLCGYFGEKIEAHHMYSWHTHKNLRFEISNGITLCQECHRGENGFHALFSLKNNTKEQLEEFFLSRGKPLTFGESEFSPDHRHSLEEVQRFFENEGCELLAFEYTYSDKPLLYICNCGRKDEISFNAFLRDHRCKTCLTALAEKKEKEAFLKIRKLFSDAGFELLETKYVNVHKPMLFRCPNGHIASKSTASFKASATCPSCNKNRKPSFAEVSAFFENAGCKLLETEYLNAKSPLKYRCSCGDIGSTSFYLFKSGVRCNSCSRKKIGEKKRMYTTEQVAGFFSKENCVLKDEYKNPHSLMEFICSCGNESKISFANFKSGKRCSRCKGKRISEAKKLKPEFVASFYNGHGFKLLEPYNGAHYKSKYQCDRCGIIRLKTWHDFKASPCCLNCRKNKDERTVPP